MTSTQTARFRPDSRILRGLAWRTGLVVVAAAAVLIELPAWARAPLSIAAALVTVLFFLGRCRTRGRVDGALTVLGVVIAVLALLGLLLNVLPLGISTASWGIGVGVIEVVALIALAYWRPPKPMTPRWTHGVPIAAIVWTLLVTGVLAGALLWSIASFNGTHVAPLAVAAVPSGGSVVVTVSSGREEGPYDLQLVTTTGRTVLAKDIRVGPENPSSITINIVENSRETLQLVRAGSQKSLRELILDTTTTTTTTTTKVTG